MGVGINFTKPTGDTRCKCIEGQYQCGHCEAEEYRNAGRRMSQEDHAYDAWVSVVADHLGIGDDE